MKQPFRPILTVMPDFGFSPFLWRVKHPKERGIGGNICGASCWDPTSPLSEPLWRLFAIWAGSFELGGVSAEAFKQNGWDWPAFQDRGIYLACLLKQAVGHEFRVVYEKPCEDPGHLVDERREILLDGTRACLDARSWSATDKTGHDRSTHNAPRSNPSRHKAQAGIATGAGLAHPGRMTFRRTGRNPLDRGPSLARAFEADPAWPMCPAPEQAVGAAAAKASMEILAPPASANKRSRRVGTPQENRRDGRAA